MEDKVHPVVPDAERHPEPSQARTEQKVAQRRRTDHEAHENDERVRFALASARMGVWEWDLNSDGVTWSSTTALAFGMKPHEAPSNGREFFELVHPDDRQSLGESTARAIRDRTDLNSEFRTISSGGVVRWVEVHGRVVYDSDGKPLRVLGVNIEISDRKSLEEQLRQARIDTARLSVLKATMRTVQDIVANALMSLQLFRVEAEGFASQESLALFDETISDTAAKLTALADLERVAETEMATGPRIDYQSGPPTERP